jgi:Acyltransferase
MLDLARIAFNQTMSSNLRPAFGSDWIWPHDQYDPISARNIRQAREIFRFQAPRYSDVARGIAYLANWLLQLRLGGSQHGTVIPILPASEIATLRAIPGGSGNILVGPHPGPVDPQLIFHLLGTVHDGPALFLMAAESYYRGGWLRRALFNRLGVIPVARGRKNPDAVRCMTEYLAQGWWGGIFPEGEVYFSREVMPMEYGAVRIAVEAALRIRSQALRANHRIDDFRAMYVTPFSYVYFFCNPTRSKRRADQALREIEAHPMIAIRDASGSIPTRLRSAADRLLENKAAEYGVPRDAWHCDDRFERVKRLQNAVLSRLETRYLGRHGSGYARRRAMDVRMACFERLANEQLSQQQRSNIEKDIQKTRELILMMPFTRAYRKKHGDLEMWIEYLRRFRSALNLRPFNFGKQEVRFKILQSVDMHPIAMKYESLAVEQDRQILLYSVTDSLRDIIQAGVDDICASRPVMRMPDPVGDGTFIVDGRRLDRRTMMASKLPAGL